MTLSFGLNPLLLLLCLLGAAGLTFWVYHRTTPALSRGKQAVLFTLRFLALFLVLFLLFEPILRRLVQETHPPLLAVLVDDSQSLGLTGEDDNGTAFDIGAAVQQTLQQIPGADLEGDLRVYRFSNDVAPLPGGTRASDSLTFSGERTNIALALDYVTDALQDQNLRGVLLVSDGQYNTGRNPLYIAERYPVPIYTVAVGDTMSRRDVQVRRITTNEIGYVGTDLPIQVGLRVEDFGGEQVAVTLLQEGAVLDQTSVTLPSGTAEVTADLTFTPTAIGLQRLVVAVTQLAGEATYRNNSEGFTVRVLERKRRILLLAGAPDPDVSALHQVLSQDPDAEVIPYVAKSPGTFYNGPLPPDLTDFDLMILVGFPSRAVGQQAAAQVARAATGGVPVIFIMGRQTDLRALQQHFGDVLPALPRAVRSTFVEASLIPSPHQHPVFDIPGVDPALWRRLPPLTYNESRWQPTPDARVLATTQVRGIPLGDPLLVIRRRNQQRVAALLGAGTWRWHNVPQDLDAVAPFWPTLLSNLVQWVTTREDNRLVRVAPVADVFGGGESITFSGQVYDESLNPINDAALTVEVTATDGTRYPFTMEAVGNGRYLLQITNLPEGTYRYEAVALREEAPLGEDQGSFAVGALTLEYKETRANVALMRQIAQRSGGNALAPEHLGDLSSRLASSGTFTPVVIEEAHETELRQRYIFLISILLLLTLEWFLRKRSGMV